MSNAAPKLTVSLPPLPKAPGEFPVRKVTLCQPGIVRIAKGDTHGGGVTVLSAGVGLDIAELPDGSIVLSGSRIVRLPPHRILEVEYIVPQGAAKK
jgi:hypothetical protein